MPLIDYKIHRVRKTDDGKVEGVLRVYEGDITTEDEFDLESGGVVPVTRYRRTAMLGEKPFSFESDKDLIRNFDGLLDEESKTRKVSVIDEQKYVRNPR